MNDSYRSQSTLKRRSRGPTILLIEDNEDQCFLIKNVLESCMPEVNLWITTTGEEAQEWLHECVKMRKSLPRLILLDVYLSQKTDGLSLLQHLKDPASAFCLVPITLLSHSDQSDDIQVGYQLGANSYIIKPSDHAQWVAYFESLRQYWLYTVSPPFS